MLTCIQPWTHTHKQKGQRTSLQRKLLAMRQNRQLRQKRVQTAVTPVCAQHQNEWIATHQKPRHLFNGHFSSHLLPRADSHGTNIRSKSIHKTADHKSEALRSSRQRSWASHRSDPETMWWRRGSCAECGFLNIVVFRTPRSNVGFDTMFLIRKDVDWRVLRQML